MSNMLPNDTLSDTVPDTQDFQPSPIAPAQSDPIQPEKKPDVQNAVQEILDKLDLLQADFEAKIKYDSSREQMIDRLHEELQTYKDDLTLSIKKTILLDLIRLYDDLGKVAQSSEAQSETAQMLQTFQEDVEDILYRHNVEPFTVEANTFDPKRQQALNRVAASDPAQHLQIAGRLRSGFAYEDKVIRAELVNVYAYSSPAATTQPQGENTHE